MYYHKTAIKIIAALILLLIIFGRNSTLYQGPSSDHFDGSRFFNREPDNTFMDHVKWLWEMDTVQWPEWIEDPAQEPPIESVENGRLRVTYINHATVLLQMDGLNILTDPVWSFRAGPVTWVGAKRVRAPGIAMDDLPRIDYVLISHDHFDLLYLRSLKEIIARHHPTILAGLGMRALLSAKGIHNVEEMDWWQTFTPDNTDFKFTFVPARHGSGRGPFMAIEPFGGASS